MARSSSAATIAVGCFALAAWLHAATPAEHCTAAKDRAAGKKGAAKLLCHARAALRSKAVDPSCLAKAETRFQEGVARADARVPCPGDAATLEGQVDDCVDDIAAAIGEPGRCAARKLRAAGKNFRGELDCHARAALGESFAPCDAKNDARMSERFADAGTCGGDFATVESIIDDCTQAIAAGTSPTTTTVPPVCGNGVVEPGEECDPAGTPCGFSFSTCRAAGTPQECTCCERDICVPTAPRCCAGGRCPPLHPDPSGAGGTCVGGTCTQPSDCPSSHDCQAGSCCGLAGAYCDGSSCCPGYLCAPAPIPELAGNCCAAPGTACTPGAAYLCCSGSCGTAGTCD
jgi:hypothetical protein